MTRAAPPDTTVVPYAPPTADNGRISGTESYTLLNRPRWLSLNSSGYDTDSGSSTFGDITYRAVFSRPVSSVVAGGFTVVDTPASLTPVVGTPVAVGGGSSSAMWDIPITTTGFTSAYTGFVTLTISDRGSIADTSSAPVAISQHTPDPSVHRYLATNPTITSVTRVGSDTRVGMGASAPLTVEWT